MEGRETATEGQRKAAAYIESQFRRLGLKPGNGNSYLQAFDLMEDSILKMEIKAGDRTYLLDKDFNCNVRFNNTASVTADKIVFVGYGISDPAYDDYAGLDVKDAIVVAMAGEPKQGENYLLSGMSRTSEWSYREAFRKTTVAMEKGAKALLIVNNFSSVVSPRKAGPYFPSVDQQSKGINYAGITHGMFTELFGQALSDSLLARRKAWQPFQAAVLKSLSLPVTFEYAERRIKAFTSTNVLGLLEGTDKKDEYLFLTAHYDHLGKRGNVIYYGADDDGSGTVSIIEMASAFAEAKKKGDGPRRSIVFMAVSGEEKGLLGSEYYSDHPVYPLDKTTADLNIDMIGRIDPSRKQGDSTNYIYVIGDNRLSSDLKPISESTNNKYTLLELDYKYNAPDDPERIYYRSDHYNFARKGVPVIFYFSGLHADYHRPTDTVEKINFGLMVKRARLIFHTAWEIANRDAMLLRDIPLSNDRR
ncbi:MAG: M28 family peptidase [Chitinophagaceae bacterium]|nr:M28 family peptidase [Chitinophagaceae bacterium]